LRWGRFSPNISVSSANHHSTEFSILTITRGKYNRPEVADVPSGSSLDSTPTMRIKKDIHEGTEFLAQINNSDLHL
jgi:hypothetical protein